MRALALAVFGDYARAFPRPRRPRERPRSPLPGTFFVPCGHVSLPVWADGEEPIFLDTPFVGPRRIKRRLSGHNCLVSLALRKLSYPDALVSLSVKKQSYLPALCSFLLRGSLCTSCAILRTLCPVRNLGSLSRAQRGFVETPSKYCPNGQKIGPARRLAREKQNFWD